MAIKQSQFIISGVSTPTNPDRENIYSFGAAHNDYVYEALKKLGYIFAYHIEKVRAQYERTPDKRVSKRTGLLVDVFKKVADKQWVITYYAFPKRNVKSIIQYGNHFDVNLISDESLASLARMERGHPEHNDGWFDIKYLGDAATAMSNRHYFELMKVARGKRPHPDIPNFEIDMDLTNGRFRFRNTDGKVLIGKELKNIFQF